MAWLPMYALGEDQRLLVDRFNDDESVAWLVNSGGPGLWRATARLDDVPAGRIGLWHVPSGPLPLLAAHPGEPDGVLPDPWQGWRELRPGAAATEPYFGPGHPGVYWLTLRLSEEGRPIEMSTIGWIGNHYASIGLAPAPATERHWRALRRWAASVAVRIPRVGPVDGPGPEISAFPEALAAILAGRARRGNPA